MFGFRLEGSNTPDKIKYMLSVNKRGIDLLNAGKLKLCLIRFSTDSKISIPRNNNTHITQINNLFRVSDQTAAENGIAF